MLEALHAAGKRLALITTSPRQNVQHLLEKYNIARLFHAIITADDVTHYKPHPEPLEAALGKLGGSKPEAVVV